jgi:predicted O-methyltransferase YrrM
MSGLTEIRPKVLFQKVESTFPSENMSMNICMPSSQIGGMSLLESSILIALARITGAKDFFEFGTYFGATSVLLAANSPIDSVVTTLDLPIESLDTIEFKSDRPLDYLVNDTDNDNYLRRTVLEVGAKYIDRASPEIRNKIKKLYKNSNFFDPKAEGFSQSYDFILIDGGHDFATIKKDTENAFELAKENAVIVWHDYRSTIHGDVTKYLDSICNAHDIVHVQSTMLAFTFCGNASI